jgi:hypothetical protein
MRELNLENLITVLTGIVERSSDDRIRDDLRQVVAALQGTGVIFINPPPVPDGTPLM